MSDERDYVLGTHDEEIERLGLQHRVWKPRATAAWRRAGFTVGQTLLDIGCGPGYVTLDLAEIVGPSGRIIALDRSRRFLDALEAARVRRGLENVDTLEVDLDDGEIPQYAADGAWSRWVFAFVKSPRDLLAKLGASIRKGGVLVLTEYFDYGTWRLTPRCTELEEFVRVAMESWRIEGGEPDIGLALPIWLEELGFEVTSLRPAVDIVPASSFVWQWPKAFIRVGLKRLVEIGHITGERADEIARAFARSEETPGTLMVTPAVVEIIAVRR